MKTITFCIFIITCQVYGQTENFHGQIHADSLTAFTVNIINLNQSTGTTNDEHGYFTIKAKTGDTILFSSIQYQRYEYVVTKNDLLNKFAKIELIPAVQSMHPVTVRSSMFSGYLSEDLTEIRLQPTLTDDMLGVKRSFKKQPTPIERKIYTARSGILDLPINLINGKLKLLRRVEQIEKFEASLQKAEKTMGTEFFTKQLAIPELYRYDFIRYCAEDPIFKILNDTEDRFKLIEFYRQKVQPYRIWKDI
ncbi:peptidase associated/transthyretin-like domain-containing protein [Aquimarina intermedia]|uniref:Carboxypeptidase-like protein n=1 Tax=Aquimarina intermedia TaxID=350814 RepID=A0A5S5BVN5_9FLAO|nr:hypothetical protein [Aquimarina intermedia]TYP71034.1 hypothetical protein BD809_11093 [Aquimarina intermedia]